MGSNDKRVRASIKYLLFTLTILTISQPVFIYTHPSLLNVQRLIGIKLDYKYKLFNY